VWHFVAGRAYEVAQQYFGCTDESQWQGLPLMGKPELGRGSHWETRIMRDDVMSYGHNTAVSSITLAAMEDLGFYLANYTAANCMSWGMNQGCNFVKYRCEEGRTDSSANVSWRSQCYGDPDWHSPEGKNLEIISENCYAGNNPCKGIAGQGWRALPGGGGTCNAQCVYPITMGCTEAPASDPEAGATPTTLQAISEAYMQWIWLGVLVLGALVLALFGRTFCCPPGGSYGIASSLSVFLVLLGAALVGIGLYARFYNYDLVSGYVGYNSLYGLIVCGGIVVILSLVSLIGLCRKAGCLLLTVAILVCMLVVAEIALVGFIIYWIYALQDVSEESLDAINGHGGGRWEGRFASDALAELESLMCRTYVLCCRDPQLDLIATDSPSGMELAGFGSGSSPSGYQTCYGHSESLSTDFVQALNDPSSKLFCPYISGSDSDTVPPDGVCDALDRIVSDFSQSNCQENFCEYGADGYFEFVNTMVEFVRTYAIAIGGVGVVLVLAQMVWVVNLYNLRATYRRSQEGVVYGYAGGSHHMKKHSLGDNSGLHIGV